MFIALALLYVFFGDTGSDLIIHVDVLRKTTTLGERELVMRFAVIGCALIAANAALARWTETRNPLAARLLAVYSCIIAGLILAVVTGIIIVN